MGISTALSNGISGLLTLGDALNVIGDNLSNINTTGFKASTTEFETVFSQTLNGGTGAGAGLFGTNPIQLGLGVTTASIRRSFQAGSLFGTGNSNDLAILGDGFFILRDGLGGISFTRDGSFDTAEDGTLVDPSTGLAVMGFPATNGVVNSSGAPVPLVIPRGLAQAQATENAVFTGNFNAAGPIADTSVVTFGNENTGPGLNGGTATAGTALTALTDPTDTTNLGLAGVSTITVTATKGTATLTRDIDLTGLTTYGDLAAALETALGIVDGSVTIVGGSLVVQSDLGDDNLFTNILLSTDVGGTEFDNVFNNLLGTAFSVTTTNTEPGESFAISGLTMFDSLGNSVPLNLTFVRVAPDTVRWFAESPLGGAVGDGTITYDGNGQFISATSTGGGPAQVSIDRTGTGALSPLTIAMDFANTSFLAAPSGSGGQQGQSSLALNTQDGFPLGDLVDFFVGVDGTILGRFSNGLTQVLGQVALANFNNPVGLLSVGENRFVVSANSGDPLIGRPGTGGRGTIASAFLEGANTDLAREFSNTIIVQRGFQANARTITTADTLLQELIGLIR